MSNLSWPSFVSQMPVNTTRRLADARSKLEAKWPNLIPNGRIFCRSFRHLVVGWHLPRVLLLRISSRVSPARFKSCRVAPSSLDSPLLSLPARSFRFLPPRLSSPFLPGHSFPILVGSFFNSHLPYVHPAASLTTPSYYYHRIVKVVVLVLVVLSTHINAILPRNITLVNDQRSRTSPIGKLI